MRHSSMCIAVLTLVFATLAGCSGDDDTLPMSASEVEDFVMSRVTDEAKDSLGVDDVACESGLEDELDDRTSCAVTFKNGDRGGAFEVLVVEEDDGELVPDVITGQDFDGVPVDGMPGIDLFD